MKPLTSLLSELISGPPREAGFVLNPGDAGLFRTLDRLSAAAASAIPASGGASIAAHVDHLRYGFSLANRWYAGEKDVFATADYAASWRRVTVSNAEWEALRAQLREEIERFRDALGRLRNPDELDEIAATGVVALIVHLAYHMGAIRQIDRSLRGPSAEEAAEAAT